MAALMGMRYIYYVYMIFFLYKLTKSEIKWVTTCSFDKVELDEFLAHYIIDVNICPEHL